MTSIGFPRTVAGDHSIPVIEVSAKFNGLTSGAGTLSTVGVGCVTWPPHPIKVIKSRTRVINRRKTSSGIVKVPMG